MIEDPPVIYVRQCFAYFPSRSFIVSGLTFLSLVHFEFIFVYGVRKCPAAAAAAKLLQSCLALCDPMDCSLPGSSVHGIFQARVLEWGAIAFSVRRVLVGSNCREEK